LSHRERREKERDGGREREERCAERQGEIDRNKGQERRQRKGEGEGKRQRKRWAS
jgi:hypothetical protein